jgi:hypothetical protein
MQKEMINTLKELNSVVRKECFILLLASNNINDKNFTGHFVLNKLVNEEFLNKRGLKVYYLDQTVVNQVV